MMRGLRRRTPTLTLAVTGATGIVTAMAATTPAIVTALQRSPAAVHGEWWRLATPVLLNPEGPRQIAVNLVALLGVGVIVERALGRTRWLAAYASGAMVGELAGLAWQPVGAGSSVAVCGLLGALAAWLWRDVRTVPARVGAAALLAGAWVLVYAHDLHGPPLLAGFSLSIVSRAHEPS